MVAVKLSIIAERIKAKIPMIHNNFFLLFVCTAPFNISKPLCKSIISTMVIAPIKKIRISEVFPKWCNKVLSKPCSAASPPERKLKTFS